MASQSNTVSASDVLSIRLKYGAQCACGQWMMK
jgi:hypothetical protein